MTAKKTIRVHMMTDGTESIGLTQSRDGIKKKLTIFFLILCLVGGILAILYFMNLLPFLSGSLVEGRITEGGIEMNWGVVFIILACGGGVGTAVVGGALLD